MKILLVEDDKVIAEQISEALSRQRYVVDVALDGRRGLEMTWQEGYSLIILDVMLPKLDGWSICEDLRRRKSTVSILMLTARDTIDDRVRGLEGGADDYLTKPFDVRELLARVRALLRRDKAVRTGQIRIGDLLIDTKAYKASRAGKELHLTPREFSLLEALARNAGRTLTREVILESVWNSEEALENTVNFHVTSLRKKLDAEYEQKLIHTVHGFGYMLRAPEEDA